MVNLKILIVSGAPIRVIFQNSVTFIQILQAAFFKYSGTFFIPASIIGMPLINIWTPQINCVIYSFIDNNKIWVTKNPLGGSLKDFVYWFGLF